MAENGKAKYYALMEEMKTDILSGKIRPGEKLPSENQLSVRYGLSRHTVRKGSGDSGRRWIHRILSGKKEPSVRMYSVRSTGPENIAVVNYIYLGLYFSQADPGD